MPACSRRTGRPSTTRHTLAPVPTIANRNGERPAPAPNAASASAAARTSDSRTTRGASIAVREIEVAPVDRVGARRPTVEVDELAQPDPDRERALTELRRQLGAVRQHLAALPLGPRRQLEALVEPARGHVDETGGDLRPADVDADREAHGWRRRLAFSIAL